MHTIDANATPVWYLMDRLIRSAFAIIDLNITLRQQASLHILCKFPTEHEYTKISGISRTGGYIHCCKLKVEGESSIEFNFQISQCWSLLEDKQKGE